MLFSPNLWRTELAFLMVLLDSSFDAFYPEICCSWPCKSAHHYLYDYNRIRVLRTNFYTARVGADALCACEQSLYWATQSGFNCASEELIYFYHPDYLGSVEFVTDMRGEPYKLARRSFSEGGFFLNTPWGDRPLRNKPVACFREGASMPRGQQDQKAFTYKDFSSRFRFNLPAGRHGGKEWDDETGNFYYGARYYDPQTSVWLSVDRLASKYPGVSPYNFTMNNPLNLIDPNGDSVNYASWKERLHVGAMRLLSSEFREQFNTLKSSENMYTYVKGSQDPTAYGEIEFVGYGKAKNELYEIRYDLIEPNDPHGRSKWHAIFEETFHASDFESGNPNMNFHRNNGKTFVGNVQGDRSVEARAWIFAGLHAPFAPKQPSARDPQTGGNMLFMNSLVPQIKAGATQTQVENALYNGYLLNYETWDAGVLLNKGTISKSLTKQY